MEPELQCLRVDKLNLIPFQDFFSSLSVMERPSIIFAGSASTGGGSSIVYTTMITEISMDMDIDESTSLPTPSYSTQAPSVQTQVFHASTVTARVH